MGLAVGTQRKVGCAMDKWFTVLLGVLVASLYVPPIVIPVRHRELCRRLNTKAFYRRFSPAPVIVGILAILVSNNSDLHHRILFVFLCHIGLGNLPHRMQPPSGQTGLMHLNPASAVDE